MNINVIQHLKLKIIKHCPWKSAVMSNHAISNLRLWVWSVTDLNRSVNWTVRCSKRINFKLMSKHQSTSIRTGKWLASVLQGSSTLITKLMLTCMANMKCSKSNISPLLTTDSNMLKQFKATGSSKSSNWWVNRHKSWSMRRRPEEIDIRVGLTLSLIIKEGADSSVMPYLAIETVIKPRFTSKNTLRGNQFIITIWSSFVARVRPKDARPTFLSPLMNVLRVRSGARSWKMWWVTTRSSFSGRWLVRHRALCSLQGYSKPI